MTGPMMHRRTLDVQRAYHEMSSALLNLEVAHDLSYGEMIAFYASELARLGKHMIRAERHPDDPDALGDEA